MRGISIEQIELPDYSTLIGLEQIGNQIFFFLRDSSFSYLYAYHLQEQSFFVRKVLPSDDSLFVLYILPKDHGYTLYESYKERAFAMELNEQLEVLGSKLYQSEEQQNLECIEQKVVLWDEEKARVIPLEDLPANDVQMRLD